MTVKRYHKQMEHHDIFGSPVEVESPPRPVRAPRTQGNGNIITWAD